MNMHKLNERNTQAFKKNTQTRIEENKTVHEVADKIHCKRKHALIFYEYPTSKT